MKPPPFLLGVTLLFWGWQSDLMLPGVIMALVIESPRVTAERWELSDQDFSRIWTFCALLFFAAAVYAFTDNNGPETFHSLFQTPTFMAQRHAGQAAARTAGSIMRWMPMIFFLFLAAQEFSAEGAVPAPTIARMLRMRWRSPKKSPPLVIPDRGVNVGYPFFSLCLFSASIHTNGGDFYYFWCSSVLIIYALWPRRARRFSFFAWAATLALAIAIGFVGQRGIVQFQRYLERFNANWMSGLFQRGRDGDAFENRTRIGQIGRLKMSGQIEVRLEQKSGLVPAYLREASFRLYYGQTWSAGPSREDFQNVIAQSNQTTWVFSPKTNNVDTGIACYLSHGSGLLPLPEGCGRLENLPAYIIQTNSAGTVVAQGPGLVIFDALSGPGTTIDSPPSGLVFYRGDYRDVDLDVHTNEAPALEQVTNELHLAAGAPRDRILRTVSEFFTDKFSYRLWQEGRPPKGETPLSNFLLCTRAGHCEYFATATVLLLRELGIPARYAVGYAVHEKSGKDSYVVRARDAHAWCIVWDPKSHLWRDFDTTPASWIEKESERASVFQWLGDSWSWVKFQVSKFRWGQGHLREIILIALIPVLALLFVQIIRNRRRRKGKKGLASPMNWPGLDSEFFLVEKRLAALGVTRSPAEPLSDWLERAATDPRLALRQPLRDLLNLHYRHRFDPLGLSASDREALRREAAACLDLLLRAPKSLPPPAPQHRAVES